MLGLIDVKRVTDEIGNPPQDEGCMYGRRNLGIYSPLLEKTVEAAFVYSSLMGS